MAKITHSCGHTMTFGTSNPLAKTIAQRKGLALEPCSMCSAKARRPEVAPAQTVVYYADRISSNPLVKEVVIFAKGTNPYATKIDEGLSDDWRSNSPHYVRFDTRGAAEQYLRDQESSGQIRFSDSGQTVEEAVAQNRQMLESQRLDTIEAGRREAEILAQVGRKPEPLATNVNPKLAKAIRDDPNWMYREDADEVLFGEH